VAVLGEEFVNRDCLNSVLEYLRSEIMVANWALYFLGWWNGPGAKMVFEPLSSASPPRDQRDGLAKISSSKDFIYFPVRIPFGGQLAAYHAELQRQRSAQFYARLL
jgi:hypothetical protein